MVSITTFLPSASRTHPVSTPPLVNPVVTTLCLPLSPKKQPNNTQATRCLTENEVLLDLPNSLPQLAAQVSCPPSVFAATARIIREIEFASRAQTAQSTFLRLFDFSAPFSVSIFPFVEPIWC